MEAGSWAFNAFNEHPWRYIVAQRGTGLFKSLFDLLFVSNQPWNKNAAVLVISFSKKTFSGNRINQSTLHDLEAADMLLTLQANSMGIYTHVIAGFDTGKLVLGILNPPREGKDVFNEPVT